MAITIEEIKYTPDPMVAGGKVNATFKIKSDEEIASVKLYTPDYRTLEAKKAGDGIYTLESDVPYDAPSGTHDITLVVTDIKGDVTRKYGQIKIG
jgi:hypothetical protein